MKKKKGFTLVELLGVIVLIGLVAAIVYPNIRNLVNNQKNKLYDKQIDLIESTAYDWIVDNSSKVPLDGSEYFLTLQHLMDDGYLKEKDIINPINNQQFTGCVIIKWNSPKYNYNYTDNCKDR